MKLVYENEIEFVKRAKALRRYFMKSYKDFIFNVSKNLIHMDLGDGINRVDIHTDSNFKKVYGNIQLVCEKKNDLITVKDLEPSDFLLDAYMYDLECFKGVPYRNDKELFKIKLILGKEG